MTRDSAEGRSVFTSMEMMADEIKRLREELAEWKEGPLPPTEREELQAKISFLEEEASALRDERDALRAQLAEAKAEIAHLTEVVESRMHIQDVDAEVERARSEARDEVERECIRENCDTCNNGEWPDRDGTGTWWHWMFGQKSGFQCSMDRTWERRYQRDTHQTEEGEP